MKKKILVVEDNRVTLKFIASTLAREGHHVVTAQDGLSALDTLTSYIPDIMFIDLIMPKIGGDKLCQIVRKMQHLDDCYIVIISGAIVEMELDYTHIGADACIAKGPFGKMAMYILEAVKESSLPGREKIKKPIMGIESIAGPMYARQMTKELLSRNQHLEIILESIAEGILEIYSKKIVYANSTAISILGMPQEKLLGSYFIDIFSEPIRSEVALLLKDGNNRHVEIGQNYPLEFKDRLITIKSLPVMNDPLTKIVIVRDVTERAGLEMQLQHVQKMEALGTIASGVAHNFRNTLAAISTNSQIIQMNYNDVTDLIDIAERIDTSVKNGAQMVDRLLQFSRKQIKAEFKLIDLSKVIKETYRLVKESFDENIIIKASIAAPLSVMGDAASLSQAFMNLCMNARDAMPDGGLINIEAMPKNDKAVVIISDTGSGMDLEIKEKCFDPFYTSKEIGKGTGLGLSITYGIVKSHEGEIKVDTILNKGSTFTLYFPLAGSAHEN